MVSTGRKTIATVLASKNIDALIVIYIPVMNVEVAPFHQAIAEGIAEGRRKGGSNKPVVACLMSERNSSSTLLVDNEKIPVYAFPESAAQVLGRAATYSEWRKEPPGLIPDFEDIDPKHAREICLKAFHERGAGWLSARENSLVLQSMKLPVARGEIAASAEEAVQLAETLGYPVTVKLASNEIVHKSEMDGVHLNLKTADEIRKAFSMIQKRLKQKGKLAAIEGVLVQSMIEDGIEIMVGAAEDPLFGALVAFGLGGIHVEVLGDVCFRINPLTDRDASWMIRQIKGYKLLRGYRGHPAADIPALEDLLLRVSRLLEEVPEIKELDLNPVFAFPPGRGCVIADVRIRIT